MEAYFHWKAQLLTFQSHHLTVFAEVFTSRPTENIDVSSAKSFALEVKLSHKSLI